MLANLFSAVSAATGGGGGFLKGLDTALKIGSIFFTSNAASPAFGGGGGFGGIGGLLGGILNGAAPQAQNDVLPTGTVRSIMDGSYSLPMSDPARITGNIDQPEPMMQAGRSVNPMGGGAPSPQPRAQSGSGLWNWLNSPTGGHTIRGIGSGMSQYLQAKAAEDAREGERKFIRERDKRRTRSYDVDPELFRFRNSFSRM